MSNLAGWKMAVLALVVGSGTYFGLEWLKPYHQPEVKLEGLVPAEQVFGATAESEPAAVASSAPAAEPAAPAPSSEPVQTAAAEPAPAVEAPPPPLPAPAPAAAPESKPVTAAKPEPASKPVAAAATAEAKPVAKKEKETAKARPAKPSKPAEAPIVATAWWQGASSSGFSVVYAGSASFRRALVIMGNAPFANADSANAAIKVSAMDGKTVSGQWELNSVNPSMLMFPLNNAGTYQLQIGAALSDAQSRQLGQSVKGPIQVR